jgi:hypothetical protein
MSARSWVMALSVWAAIAADPLGTVLAAEAPRKNPKCAIIGATKYTVTVTEWSGVCTPVRTIWLWYKDKEVAELMFWKDTESPGGIPIIAEDEWNVFHADLLLSDFEAIYGILKSEKQVEIVF